MVPNTPTSLQTTLPAEVRLAEGKFFLEEQIFGIEIYLIYGTGTRRPAVSNEDGENLEPRQNLKKNSAQT
jgi:hypothetical protein